MVRGTKLKLTPLLKHCQWSQYEYIYADLRNGPRLAVSFIGEVNNHILQFPCLNLTELNSIIHVPNSILCLHFIAMDGGEIKRWSKISYRV